MKLIDPGDQSETRRRIYLARHGAVEYFDPSGKPYHSRGVPLSPLGRDQAAALAEALAGVPIDRVVTSDLPRTIETAQIAVGTRTLPSEQYEELREIESAKRKIDDLESMAARIRGAFVGNIDRQRRFMEGEAFGDFLDRVVPCFDRVIATDGWKHLLLVAHGGVNRAIICRALGLGLEAFASLEQDTACLNIIDIDESNGLNAGQRFIVRLLNSTTYDTAKKEIVRTTMEKLYFDFEKLISGAAPT